MRKLLSTSRLSVDERRKALIFCVGIILLVSSFAEAQSGRRPPKRTESEGVQRPTDPDPPVKPSETKQTEKDKTPVLVVKSTSYFSSSYYADYLLEGCAARLKQAAEIAVEKSTRDMNRKEAGDAAMPPTPRYVVLLELESERSGYVRRNDGRYNPDNLVVQYTLFTMGTGKIKTSGRIYPRRAGTTVGGVGLPLPVPTDGPAAAEYILKQAGREAADRVIDSLRTIPSPKN